MSCFALIDRDYMFETEVEDLIEKARSEAVNLHIWKRKEIENYLIVPKAMHRLIKSKSVSFAEFEHDLEGYIDANFKEDIIDQYATKIQDVSRNNPTKPIKITAGEAHKKARHYIDQKWININNKIDLLPGKIFVQSMVQYMFTTYATQFKISKLLKVMTKNEVDVEVKNLLDALS
jgi:hypothetical protein